MHIFSSLPQGFGFERDYESLASISRDMKVESFIEKIRTIDYPFSLDRKFEGNCPCFYIKKTFEGKTVILDGHCWRTCSECPGCGIHVRGTLAKCQLKHIARELKKRLDEQDWYGEWSIVYI